MRAVIFVNIEHKQWQAIIKPVQGYIFSNSTVIIHSKERFQ